MSAATLLDPDSPPKPLRLIVRFRRGVNLDDEIERCGQAQSKWK